MRKVYTSAIVLIPPEDKWGAIQEIRKQYDRQIRRWMPHLTLLYPFWPTESFPKALEKLSQIQNIRKPFLMELKMLKYFEHRHNSFTIWLSPDPKEPIIELQRMLLKIFPECNDVNKFENGFTPHLSLGQIQGRKNLKDLLFQLQKNWTEIKFIVSELYLINREADKASSFKIYSRIPLKTEE